MLERLIAGDERGIRESVRRMQEQGASIADIADTTLAPALTEIGEKWESGEITVAEEARASGIAERALGLLPEIMRGPPQGVAVVASPDNDAHHLAGAMATAALREEHWAVHHLPIGLSHDDVISMVEEIQPELVVLSVTLPQAGPRAKELADALGARGFYVAVGSPGSKLADLLAVARSRAGATD